MFQSFGRQAGFADNMQIFKGSVSASSQQTWYTWQKPTDKPWVYILMTSAGGGGGGGGSSPTVKIICPSIVLPDILYIAVGDGGTGGKGQIQGGAAATAGNNGGASYLSIRENGTTSGDYLYTISGCVGGAVAQSNGAAGTATLSGYLLAVTSQANGSNGGNGNASGASSGASGITSATGASTGGAGVNAGTTTAAAGSITLSPTFFQIATLAGGTSGGGRGSDGLDFFNFGLTHTNFNPCSMGGTGGGSNTSNGTGGAGGNGGPGSGGGGGGGSNGASSIGGAGGNGGPGMVLICCF